MKPATVHRSAHSVHQLYLHMVFVTKGRRRILNIDKNKEYQELFSSICVDIGIKLLGNTDKARTACELIEFGMDCDHVHLLLRYPPTISVAQLAQYLKGISSRRKPPLIKEGVRTGPLWSTGYFAKTVGNKTAEATRNYAHDHEEKSQAKRAADKASDQSRGVVATR